MADVFISYSRHDRAKVARLARAIAAEGYDVWWDEELPPHRSYGDVITDKIAGAGAAVVVWSADAIQSEWVRAEADMARNQRKLIQTALDNVMPPLPFNQIQFAEIGDWEGEADHPGWRKVKLSLKELCGQRISADPETLRTLPEPPPPGPQSATRWPLFAAIGVAVVLLGGAVAYWAAQRDTTRGEAAPAIVQVDAKDVPGIELTTVEPGQETPASSFNLLATVADPDGYSNLRDGPSASGRVLRRVQVGEAFATYRQPGDWWQVRLPDGATGYIARSRIRLSGEADAEAEPRGETRFAGETDQGGETPASNPSDMTFADSSTRLLAASELAQLGPSTLRVARNEIYARKGRRFKDPWLRDYFGRFAWYRPRHDEVPLNQVEQRNVETILAAEARFQ